MERELLLLGLLKQEAKHGYELYDFIEQYMQTCVDLKKSTAYYLLDKMAKAGYVTERTERSGRRPLKKVYALTDEGENYFDSLLRENLAQYTQAHFGSMVGLFFLDELEREEALALLAQRRGVLVMLLAGARRAPRHPDSQQYVIEHQIVHLESELAWLDSIIGRLQAEDE